MFLGILILSFASVFILSQLLFPSVVDKFTVIQQKRSKKFMDNMDRAFVDIKRQKVTFVYMLGPIFLGILGYFMFPAELRLVGVIVGAAVGFVGPSVYVKALNEKRKEKFDNQLIDGLMILSSSLKGGLSVIQSIEVLSEEMSPPISQEFAILLGENKMGVSMEDAFSHLLERMPSTALHQMITAILLARETGGNLPVIFSNIVATIRENKKIKQNIDTLTLQGKIQGAVMILLPIAFAIMILSTNPAFFNSMFETKIGKGLLVYSVISEVIGAFLIWKISTYKEF